MYYWNVLLVPGTTRASTCNPTTGTGGTRIRPAFKYVDENWQDFNFKKLVIFTDCEIGDYGDEPQFDEPCDIIWICCQSKEKLGSYYLPPYGTTIFIDD